MNLNTGSFVDVVPLPADYFIEISERLVLVVSNEIFAPKKN